ncbi:MAG: TetR family transcriptional regulator [Actinomycetia bacterium]|nr:TetR family transcriptional regulator [Actinomycetes bacterium]
MLPAVASSSKGRPEDSSPKRRAKQHQIIEAAKEVLTRDGLAACTARTVADASPLTKSAIHYYFDDMDEIIDGAMTAHLSAFLDHVREAAARHESPADRFWAAVRAYLEMFAERPSTALLWFSYWVEAGQKSRIEPIDRMHQDVTAVLRDLLADIPVDAPTERAHALFSYLLGTVIQQAVRPLPFPALTPEIATLCHLNAPHPESNDQQAGPD